MTERDPKSGEIAFLIILLGLVLFVCIALLSML